MYSYHAAPWSHQYDKRDIPQSNTFIDARKKQTNTVFTPLCNMYTGSQTARAEGEFNHKQIQHNKHGPRTEHEGKPITPKD